jgi:hypothetical protein
MICDYEWKVGREMNESHLTPELTGRETTSSSLQFDDEKRTDSAPVQ